MGLCIIHIHGTWLICMWDVTCWTRLGCMSASNKLNMSVDHLWCVRCIWDLYPSYVGHDLFGKSRAYECETWAEYVSWSFVMRSMHMGLVWFTWDMTCSYNKLWSVLCTWDLYHLWCVPCIWDLYDSHGTWLVHITSCEAFYVYEPCIICDAFYAYGLVSFTWDMTCSYNKLWSVLCIWDLYHLWCVLCIWDLYHSYGTWLAHVTTRDKTRVYECKT